MGRSTTSARRTLPNPIREVVRNGIEGPDLTRSDVAREARRVMLSAIRAGWKWPEVENMLTNRDNRLAVQIGTGRGGRPINPNLRRDFLAKHWREVHDLARKRPAWTRDDVLDFIEHVRDHLDRDDAAIPDERERAVIDVVLDLAAEYGTSRVAVPVHIVSDRTGISKATAHRILMRLCQDAEWLSLASRGNARTLRANLYNLAPGLASTYGGATPPVSQAPPMSHPPMSHEEQAVDQIILTRELAVKVLGEAALARLLDAAQNQPGDAEVRHLHAVGEDQ